MPNVVIVNDGVTTVAATGPTVNEVTVSTVAPFVPPPSLVYDNESSTFVGTQTFAPVSVSTVPVVFKGLLNQTANLAEWQNSTGTVLTQVTASGIITAPRLVLGTPSVVSQALSLKQTTQSVNGGLRIEDSASTSAITLSINSGGDPSLVFPSGSAISIGPAVASGTGSLTLSSQRGINLATDLTNASGFVRFTAGGLELFRIDGGGQTTHTVRNAGQTPLVSKGVAAQTANLQEWRDSADVVLGAVSAGGTLAYTASNLRTTGQPTRNLLTTVDNNGSVVMNQTGVGTNNGFALQTAGVNRLTISGDTTAINGSAASALDAALHVYNLNAAYVGLRVRAAASQTADLQQWQNSAGTALLGVRSDGSLLYGVNGFAVRLADGSSVLDINNLAMTTNRTLSTAAITVVDGSGNVLSYGGGGSLTYSNTVASQLSNDRGLRVRNVTTTFPTLVVQGAASQTADLQQWQNSAGTAVLRVFSDGLLAPSSINFQGLPAPSNTPHLTLRGGATFSHRTSLGLDGDFLGGNIGFDSGASLVHALIRSTSTTTISLVVRAAASQTADLQQWQNSAGTVLTRVKASGELDITAATGKHIRTDVFGNNIALEVSQNDGGASRYPLRLVGATNSILTFGNTATGGALFVNTATTTQTNAVFRAFAGQTANIQEWQNSAGTSVARVSSAGGLAATSLNVSGIATVAAGGTSDGLIIEGPNELNGPGTRTVRFRANTSASGIQDRSQITAGGEFEHLIAGSGILLRSPDGTRYRITVDNNGSLVTTVA